MEVALTIYAKGRTALAVVAARISTRPIGLSATTSQGMADVRQDVCKGLSPL